MTLEREVVERYATVQVGKDGLAVFVDGEKEIALGVEGEAGDVASVSEGEGMRLVAEQESQYGYMRLLWKNECALDKIKHGHSVADGR